MRQERREGRVAVHHMHGHGYPVDAEVVAALSPYTTAHLTRFGRYSLDPSRVPAVLDYDAPILSTPPGQGVPDTARR